MTSFPALYRDDGFFHLFVTSFLLLRIRNSKELDISFCSAEAELKAGKLFVFRGNVGIKFEFALCANRLRCYGVLNSANHYCVERKMIAPTYDTQTYHITLFLSPSLSPSLPSFLPLPLSLPLPLPSPMISLLVLLFCCCIFCSE